jgi:hypothetical protein
MWLGISISVVVLGAIAWGATRKSRVGHCMRVGVMFLSGGFIFPNALIEDEAITVNYVQREVKGKSQ